jgi:N-acetylneuraminic acid mutarotase
MKFVFTFLCVMVFLHATLLEASDISNIDNEAKFLEWAKLPALPDKLGVAGPFVGVHLNPKSRDQEVLIIAGGANFPVKEGQDLWEVPKVYHDDAWVLTREKGTDGETSYKWISGLEIEEPRAYGACVSTEYGVVCIGGRDDSQGYDNVFLLSWDGAANQLKQAPLPPLPEPSQGGSAAMIGDTIYLVGGMTGTGLATASRNFWSLDMSLYGNASKIDAFVWKKVLPWPGPERAMAVVVSQHNGFDQCIYVMSGRRALGPDEDYPEAIRISESDVLLPFNDVYEFCPARYDASAYNPETEEYNGTGRTGQPYERI